MHQEVLAQSPLLVLPVLAMFLFMAVWVIAAVRVMTRSRSEMEEAAQLPLGGDDHDPR
jgi:hypothetical protein